ncbi:ribosome small subunit-dependent GTPase A [Vallitalea okinawensis]|uniref:ribosome small subunit-dependent GTPase A n=1 Tax=Vallitalea okinawensis TaxID=2078660 RepID=UPI001FA864AD|nr:ribosome small subunit-dependent GTPase A [Vallitalea okinawensis]
MMPEDEKGIPARIIAVHKERYELICKYGQTYGRLKASSYYKEQHEIFPTTGDFVFIQYNESGDSQIIKTLERKSKFSRNDFSGHAVEYVKTVKEQVVASNFDYVFIMASLNHDFNLKRIERYLTLAWQSGGIPVIVLTKLDLVDNYTEQTRAVEKIAASVGVFAVSAKTGHGINLLSDYLRPGKTIVLLGSSGVGKSSLVNVLAGEEIMVVNDIREDDSRGRHTTTHRQLIMLSSGAMIIDTPGMRELGMWNINVGLNEAFTDVESYFARCKFSDCRHKSEPGCAIKQAIEIGELSEERWNSYLQIKSEAQFVNNKARCLREKDARNKSIAMWNKKKKRKG